ncbi:unnamed protein product [Macrosiphum euphorbiae]|uniref:Uncharacterized protein n=1 Tax=Macrosiphum euphorbiae TaxID=13131 RepID=A0AAV0VL28_9HEMI|nr:unnamed protein product [Macrosiphum euphorbiae]
MSNGRARARRAQGQPSAHDFRTYVPKLIGALVISGALSDSHGMRFWNPYPRYSQRPSSHYCRCRCKIFSSTATLSYYFEWYGFLR